MQDKVIPFNKDPEDEFFEKLVYEYCKAKFEAKNDPYFKDIQ